MMRITSESSSDIRHGGANESEGSRKQRSRRNLKLHLSGNMLDEDRNTTQSFADEMESGRRGWTGSIPSVAGPSHSPSTLIPRLPGSFSTSPSMHSTIPVMGVSEFAERFKYLVCSSGILEKDYVRGLGLGDGLQLGVDQGPDILGKGDPLAQPDSPRRDFYFKLECKAGRARHQLVGAKKRWDIALAVGVLLSAMIWLLGRQRLSILAVTSGALWFSWTVLSHTAFSSQQLEIAPTDYRSSALRALEQFLDASRSLDTTFESSIAFIQAQQMDGIENRTPRIALSRFTDNLTDQIASVTSRLLEMADKNELAVLGEMYDIPVSGRKRRSRVTSDDWQEAAVPPIESASEDLFHAPDTAAQTAQDFQAYPMSLTQSLPHHSPQHHLRRLSLASATIPRPRPLSPRVPIDWHPRDRFTSLPPRTPRSSKRLSLDPELWASLRNQTNKTRQSLPPQSTGSNANEAGTIEVRETVQDETVSDSEDLTTASTSRTSPDLGDQPYSPFRSSPLAYRSFSASIPSSARLPETIKDPRLASPDSSAYLGSEDRARSKRRSLQAMPYYASSTPHASPSKHRAANHNSSASDLQELRSRVATGNRSHPSTYVVRTAPFAQPPSTSTQTPPFPRSVPIRPGSPIRHHSTSPLTLTSIRASCLGAHLKRRRMACCLLGLRFDANDEYWREISALLAESCASWATEVAELQEAIAEARTASPVIHEEASQLSAHHGRSEAIFDGTVDFAPRRSDEDLLVERVEEMQTVMGRLWGDIEAVKRDVEMGNPLEDGWNKIRGDMGSLIREWERGRQAATRIASTNVITPSESEERTNSLDIPSELPEGAEGADDGLLPAFTESWESERPETEMEGPEIERSEDVTTDFLPPPGVDQVFEADVDEQVITDKPKMSRGDRIRLVKEARAKGVSVDALLLRSRSGGSEILRAEPDGTERTARLRSGEVVEELKGMIGLIRRKKGLEDTSPSVTTYPEELEVSESSRDLRSESCGVGIQPGLDDGGELQDELFQSVTRSSRGEVTPRLLKEDMAFPTEELRRSFVFPTLESSHVA